MQQPGGFLLLNKPEQMTSRQALTTAGRRLKLKGGVEGILDPFASGLLIAAYAASTRYLQYFHSLDKTYLAEIQLGIETDTLDPEGEIIAEKKPPELNAGLIDEALARFRGRIEQVPPAYSNLKINGRRARDLARAGIDFELPPRSLEIHRLEMLTFSEDSITIECRVQAGTYIRSLGRDIARALGTAGYLKALYRRAIGPYSDRDAVEPGNAEPEDLHLPGDMLSHIEPLSLPSEKSEQIRNGRAVQVGLPDGIYRLFERRGNSFVGLVSIKAETARAERLMPLN